MRGGLGLRVDLSLNPTRGAGAAVSPYATSALALDYKNGEYWRSGTSYAETALPGRTFTRTGAKGEQDLAGAVQTFATNTAGIVPNVGFWVRPGATNLLLNAGQSSSLPPQDVTLTAVAHTLSFIGTGTVTLSGAATGSLVGTGATARVKLAFTPTAGIVTFTVTGSVTFAGLVVGLPMGPIIATAGSSVAVTADTHKIDYTLADEDWLIWAKGNYQGPNNAEYQLLATFDNGTTGQMIFLGRNPNGSAGVGVVSTSNVLSATTTGLGMPMNGAGEAIVGLMRRAGKYTVISRYGGSTTFKAESAALAMPTGIANLRAGKQTGALYYADAPVEFIGHRIGTFTNEAAAVAIGTPYNGTAVGDSTVADYLGNNNLLFYVDTSLEKKNLAVPGNNISQQDTAFANSGAAITAKWVIIQVGLNDLDPAESTTAAKIALLQNLVDDARAKAPATSKIFISKMVPCRARLISLYGATNGPISYQRWLDMNEAIAGGGATPITNVDGRITAHEPLMNDGAGNLKAEYDTGDGIHPNNAGRAVNGQAWEDALSAAGVLG